MFLLCTYLFLAILDYFSNILDNYLFLKNCVD